MESVPRGGGGSVNMSACDDGAANTLMAIASFTPTGVCVVLSSSQVATGSKLTGSCQTLRVHTDDA